MNRLIGQLEGIRRMINGRRKPDDIVQQIMAARQALTRIGMIVLKEEISKTSKPNQQKRIDKMLEQIFRV
ncbi:hypothetical protein A3D06_02110 [Candidatus Roizmanbacteria bacterium RIFCSPHIGHO2_02_FULL_40_9]|uniref:Uncharacterized protein n=1 Tax=Candidatus Roizmanbacteria bacterium RIFCSPHIGHO2_02_FULL_40_9 TaxID=1802042 RepID=A0A1F7HC48_9BACT|nr:MAG: hypothetical protein A3D06_02110 [Candidatus Roizmanbacteria bacterium RIFCSPHIGHO2_02_FULL_40_9]